MEAVPMKRIGARYSRPNGRTHNYFHGHESMRKWLVHNNELCLETGKEPEGAS